MKQATNFWQRLAALGIALGLLAPTAEAQTAPLSQTTLNQIAAIAADKASRTPAQQKMDSHLIYAARESRDQFAVMGVPSLRSGAELSNEGRVLVDIRAYVTPMLLSRIMNAGGSIVSSLPAYYAIRAWLPPTAVEYVAASSDVVFIQPALRAETDRVAAPAVAGEGAAAKAPAHKTLSAKNHVHENAGGPT